MQTFITTTTHVLSDDFQADLPGDTGTKNADGRIYDFTLAAKLEEDADEIEEYDIDSPYNRLRAAIHRAAATKFREQGILDSESALESMGLA